MFKRLATDGSPGLVIASSIAVRLAEARRDELRSHRPCYAGGDALPQASRNSVNAALTHVNARCCRGVTLASSGRAQRRVEREMEMEASQWRESSRRQLASDLTTLRRGIEDYLTAYAGQTGEAVVSGRERLLASIAAARQRLSDLEGEATGAADALVHEKAWQAIAVAAGLGFIAGWVTARLRV